MPAINPLAFLSQYPVIGLVVFIAVSLGVLMVLSEGKLVEALKSILRVIVTVFTTPFVFLRDALAIIRASGENEQDYERSRVFMMFRLNRIQYLVLLVICLLTLSSGVTTSLLSLYPSSEIAQGRMLDEQIDGYEAQVQTANEAVASAAAPGFREDLQTRATAAQTAYQQQVTTNAQFVQSTIYTNQLISQLANTRNRDFPQRVRAELPQYMQSCPRGYGWQGMGPQDCAQFTAFILELADRKDAEFGLSQAATDAQSAFQEADNAAQIATANQQAAQQQLDYAREQRNQVSLFNPDMIGARISAAISILIGTIGMVIAIVWIGAIILDIWNWIILMMRAMEQEKQAQLDKMRGQS
jgi:hypothetical protein